MESKGLLPISKLQEMEETMVGMGARLTGSTAHINFINYIENEMTSLGYEVKEDLFTFKRWEPEHFALSYQDKGNTVNVETRDISYYPYSGCTTDDGITAPMKWCGKEPISSFLGTKNKIAVISMPIIEAGCGLVFKKRSSFPEDFIPPTKQGSPVVSTFVIPPLLKIAKAEGAKAVICIMTGCSDDMARHQYLPFINTYAGIPALWVNETVGKNIIKSAKKGENAHLTLKAQVFEKSPTRTIYAVLKGSEEESILINTHTDGTNAFEENAAIGLISLAKYFAEKPLSERKKTLVFSFVTGHFQLHQFGNALNQATTKFLNAHKELWDGKNGNMQAVAGVTLEHLGCSQWGDNDEHTAFICKGSVDPELVYTSNNIMANIYMEQLKDRKHTKTITLCPKNMIHFGEGQPIYKKGIPSISLCPGPDYLCNNAEDGYIDKINYDMMYEQIDTFRKVIEVLEHKTRKDLGRKQGFYFGLRF